MKTRMIVNSVAGMLALSLAFPIASEAATPMKIAHLVPAAAPRGQGVELMSKMLREDSRCDIAPQHFPSSQLGGTTDLIEGLQIGSVEMVLLPGSFLVGFQPLIGIMDFPYFWPRDYESLKAVEEGEAMKQLLATTVEKGVVSLAVWHTGYKTWTANKPLNTVESYKGIKARSMPSEIIKMQDRLMGMQPVDMPFSETYAALNSGAIDTQENPIPTVFFMKFHEVQDYITLSNHGTLDQVVMVSKIWWDKLSGDCQTAVREAVHAGGERTANLIGKVIQESAFPAFKKAGMASVEVSADVFEALGRQVLPKIEKYYVEQNDERAAKILDAFKREIAARK